MNDGLLDAIRHNIWATSEILDTCAALDQHQLNATTAGTYGTIHVTLGHIMGSDASYCAQLVGVESGWDLSATRTLPIDELRRLHQETAARWEAFLEQPFDAERLFVDDWDDGSTLDMPAGVVIAQAVHHGNEHRTQIATILTSLDLQPPSLGVWEFAIATKRARTRTTPADEPAALPS